VTYEPPGHLRRYIAIALQGHAKLIRGNGYEPPDGFDAYADRLLAPDDDAMTRRKYLQAANSRRYRRRKKETRTA